MRVKQYAVKVDNGSELHHNFTVWQTSREAAIQETIAILESFYKDVTFEVDKHSDNSISPTKIIGKGITGSSTLHDVVAIVSFTGERA